MNVLPGKLWVVLFAFFAIIGDSFAATLSGTIYVNQTDDTAADAKIKAINSARRQILTNVLSQYSNKVALEELIQNSTDEDLMNLIVSSSVSNEQMSTTLYSANVTMNIDNDATKKWLDSNEVQNWVPLIESNEKFTVSIVVPNGIVDWAELKRIAREDKIEIETMGIKGNQIIAKMPLSYRTKFTAAVRSAGWKYADNDGVLQIWK